MKVIEETHREENGRTIVHLSFKNRDQLLDPDDPSPLHQKELTPEAEDAILNNVFARRQKNTLTLEIAIPGSPDPGPTTEIIDAIRHHFRFVLTEHKRDTAIFVRERRITLVFLVINIFILLFYISYVESNPDFSSTITGMAIGGIIIIMNWATIWDSYEFFIFDSREKLQRKKLLNKIIDAEIKVIPVK